MVTRLAQMTAAEYHADPFDRPSLTQSVAHTLVSKSAYHAWLEHPKLGTRPRHASKEMGLGTIYHALLLGQPPPFAVAEWHEPGPDATLEADLAASLVGWLQCPTCRYECQLAHVHAGDPCPSEDGALVPHPNPPKPPKAKKARSKVTDNPPPAGPDGRPEWTSWQRGDAKAAKAAILAAGLVPVLPREKRHHEQRAATLRRNIEALGIDLLAPGTYQEVTALWTETTDDGEEVQCRGRLDFLEVTETRAVIRDLKIVRSAHANACQRHAHDFGLDVQHAAYTRAIASIFPELAGRVAFEFLFCEEGTGLAVPRTLTGEMRLMGEHKWRRAVRQWARCLRANEWPGYAPDAIDAYPWAMAAEQIAGHDDEERAIRQPIAQSYEQHQEEDDDAEDETDIF